MSAFERLRDWEAARIARWFRETEYGLVFYDSKGRALPIAERERRRWQSQAIKQLDHFLAEHARAPLEALLIAILLFAAAGFAIGWLSGFVPLLRQIPPPLAAAPACLWPTLHWWRFRRRQAALRRQFAERLMLRTPLPEAAAAANRRFNIFAGAQVVVVEVLIVVGAVTVFRGDPESFDAWPMLALVALAWPLHWAARKVDATHRRKPG
jgi:hypothetical protein